MKNPMEKENLLMMIAGGAVIVAGSMMRSGLQKSWKKVKKTDPPMDPSDTDTAWGDALLWAGLSGVTVAITRLIVRRLAAEGIAKMENTKAKKVDVS